MTLTVSLTQVGIVRATEILHWARNDAARLHQEQPQTVSVPVEPPADDPSSKDAALPPRQQRVVDLQI